jgi:hypothetical protein
MQKDGYDPASMMLLKSTLNRSIKGAGVFFGAGLEAVNADRRHTVTLQCR